MADDIFDQLDSADKSVQSDIFDQIAPDATPDVVPVKNQPETNPPVVNSGAGEKWISNDDGGFGATGNFWQAQQSAKDSKPSDPTLNKLAPKVSTPEQSAQLQKVVGDIDAPKLPTPGTVAQAADAAFAPPKPFTDLVDVGRSIQENNRDTTLALRGMAKKAGLDPDRVAKLPSLAMQYMTGAGNAVIDTALSFTSPGGLATLGFGALPKAVQKAASVGFSAQMLSQFPQAAQQLLDEESKPDSEKDHAKIAQLYFGAMGDAGFGILAGAHGLSKSEPSAPVNSDTGKVELDKNFTPVNKPSTTGTPDAIQEPQTGTLLQPPPQGNGEEGGGRGGVEQSQQGQEVAPPVEEVKAAQIPPVAQADAGQVTPPNKLPEFPRQSANESYEEGVLKGDAFIKIRDAITSLPYGTVFVLKDGRRVKKTSGRGEFSISQNPNGKFNLLDKGVEVAPVAIDELSGSEIEQSQTSPAPEPIVSPTAKPIDVIQKVLALPPKDFSSAFPMGDNNLTQSAYRLGRILTTPDELQAVQDAQAATKANLDKLKQAGDLNAGMAEATRHQFFNEAYQAATGTGSAGLALAKDPSYKPPFPIAKPAAFAPVEEPPAPPVKTDAPPPAVPPTKPVIAPPADISNVGSPAPNVESSRINVGDTVEFEGKKIVVKRTSPDGSRVVVGKRSVPASQVKKIVEPVKEPWQYSKSEWSSKIKKEYGMQGFPDLAAKQATDATHRNEVEQALKQGKPVPPEVLKDYPNLAPKPAVENVAEIPAVHLAGSTGDRAAVLVKHPNAKPAKTNRTGAQYPIYEIRSGKQVLGEGHGTTDAWRQTAQNLYRKPAEVPPVEGGNNSGSKKEEWQGLVTPAEREKFIYNSAQMSPTEFARIHRLLPLSQQLPEFEFRDAAKIANKSASILTDKPKWEAAFNKAIMELGEKHIARRHEGAFGIQIHRHQPVNAEAVEAYKIELPAGYEKDGDLYVFKGDAKSETSQRAVENGYESPKAFADDYAKNRDAEVNETEDEFLNRRYCMGAIPSRKSIVNV